MMEAQTGLLFAVVLDMGINWMGADGGEALPGCVRPCLENERLQDCGAGVQAARFQSERARIFRGQRAGLVGTRSAQGLKLAARLVLAAARRPDDGRAQPELCLLAETLRGCGGARRSVGHRRLAVVGRSTEQSAVQDHGAAAARLRRLHHNRRRQVQYHAITTAVRQNDLNHMVLGYRYYSINRPVLGSPSAWVDVIDYHLYAHGPCMHGPPLTSLSRRTTSPGSRSWFLSSAAARATLARPTRLAPGPCT